MDHHVFHGDLNINLELLIEVVLFIIRVFIFFIAFFNGLHSLSYDLVTIQYFNLVSYFHFCYLFML
jgi:hypothetical protein